jgi:hypothetical protein
LPANEIQADFLPIVLDSPADHALQGPLFLEQSPWGIQWLSPAAARICALSCGPVSELLLCVVGFLVAASNLPLAAELVQTGPPGYTSDNSDWWSYTRRPEADDEAISQKRELPASNFQILGFKLNDETSAKLRLNWEKPLLSSVAMHRRGVLKSATHHRAGYRRPISYSKKARSTMHSIS